MFKCLFQIGIALGALQVPIGLLTSSSTKESFLTSLQQNFWGVEDHLEQLLNIPFAIRTIWEVLEDENSIDNWKIPQSFMDEHVVVIIDAGNNIHLTQFLADRAIKDGFQHIVLERSFDPVEGELPWANTLYLEAPYRAEAEALLYLLQNYDWINICFIYDEEQDHPKLVQYMKENFLSSEVTVRDEVVIQKTNNNLKATLVSRFENTTRDSEARVFILVAEPGTASVTLYSGDITVMGGSGYAWILSSSALINLADTARSSHADEPSELFSVLSTGTVGFIDEQLFYQVNDPLTSLQAAITLVAQAYEHMNYPFAAFESVTGEHIRSYIMSNPLTPTLPFGVRFGSDGIRIPKYDFYNMQDFVQYKVGSFDFDSKAITAEGIVWPGFETKVPNDKLSIMKIMLLYPVNDEQGLYFPDGEYIRKGFDLALDVINDNPEYLPEYRLEGVYVDTYMSQDLASVRLKSTANINIVGYVGPYASDVARKYQEILDTNLNPMPMISYASSAYYLNSSDLYPRFFRTVQPDGLEAVALAMFLQQENIKQVGVLYTSDAIGIGQYESLMGNINSLDVEILNHEEHRMIFFSDERPLYIGRQTIDDVDRTLSHLVELQIKVFVVLGNDIVTAEIAKTAHKKELYGKDYAWLGTIWLTNNTQRLIQNEYRAHMNEIYEALEGAIGINYRLGIDQLGEEFGLAYDAKYGENYTAYSMYAYDCVLLLATTLNGMVERGEDFNDGNELAESIRGADFTAVSGKLKFSEGTNDRSAVGYAVYNMQSGEILKVLEYDPLDPTLFVPQPGASLKYYRGTTPPVGIWPDDETHDCPFAVHMMTISWEGLGIIVSIGVFLFLLTLFLSFLSYSKWKQIDIKVIDGEVTRSWKDTLVQATIVIEFFQFIAIAPSFESLRVVIEVTANIFMMDAMKIAQGEKDSYWDLLVIVCILTYAWFGLVLLIMTDAEHWTQAIPICQRLLSILNTVYLPFIGNTMFLPFTALLLDPLVCDHKAQGYSVVRRDCYMNCWTDEHMTYVIMAVVGIAVYQPIAVFSRPLWQQARAGLNLMAKPFFLLFKTCVQMVLIAVGKSLQGVSPVSHGIVFTILSFAFAVLTYKIHPFNYERCNLYEVASLLAVSYLSLVATVSYFYKPKHFGWFVGLCIGWMVIGGITFLIQKKLKKYTPMLKAPGKGKKSTRIVNLFHSRKTMKVQPEKDFYGMQIQGKPPTPADDSMFEKENSRDITNQVLDNH